MNRQMEEVRWITSACRTMLLADKFSPSDSMHRNLGILPLEKRRTYHRAVDCHKHIFNDKSSLAKYFKNKTSGRATRSGEVNKVIPDIRSSMGRNAYSFRGPHSWNVIPAEGRTIENHNEFKSYMHNLLTNNE